VGFVYTFFLLLAMLSASSYRLARSKYADVNEMSTACPSVVKDKNPFLCCKGGSEGIQSCIYECQFLSFSKFILFLFSI
jgi:hypothetical protein